VHPSTTAGGKCRAFGSSVRPLTPISRDAISLYLAKGFQRNSARIFIMWVVLLKKHRQKSTS